MKASTRGSSASASSTGKGSGSRAAHDRAERPVGEQHAEPRRRAPRASRFRSAAGGSSRDRFAPSASRIATSRRRLEARASSRLAMLRAGDEQHDPDDGHQHRGQPCDQHVGRRWPFGSSRASSSGTAAALRPLLSTGKACSRLAKTVRRFDRACCDRDAGLQPRRTRRGTGRAASRHHSGCGDERCATSAATTDGPPPSSVPVKCFGATPIDGVGRAVEGQRLADDRRDRSRGCAPRSRR